MRINNSQVALLLVDVQNDFLPGGALAVREGDRILPVIQKLQGQFSRILATQDFHPKDHESFASNHPGKTPGDVIDLHGLPQVLWPVHCVQGTWGAAFSEQLQTSSWEAIFQKGKNVMIFNKRPNIISGNFVFPKDKFTTTTDYFLLDMLTCYDVNLFYF
ncbi:MAG: isochorismatase family protein [Cyclobacteriaceae bacterium]|nr:isochorismatase family protein [Cyclobacteriaceae bacterium]